MSEREFQQVTRKKWIARKQLGRHKHYKTPGDYLNTCEDVNVDEFKSRLEGLCARIVQSDYYQAALETLQQHLGCSNSSHPLEQIVCLGLGPFTRSHQALHQAAFIFSLQRELKIKDALFYDPVFRDSEKDLIIRFDGQIMVSDCEGKHEADVPTLYYLPHCQYALMHNLLWRNWNSTNLRNVLLISNSFEMLTTNRIKHTEDLIKKISQYCKETQLEDDYKHRNVFNDLSLHIFPGESLPLVNDLLFWDPGEPLPVTEDELNAAELKLNALCLK